MGHIAQKQKRFSGAIGVGNATPSATGAGITFPAAYVAATGANTLDDYERGTFALGLTFAVPGDLAVTITSTGRYAKIGDICIARFEVDTAAFTHTTASGLLRLTGLPFTAGAPPTATVGLGGFAGVTKANYTQFGARTVNGQTYLAVYASGQGQPLTNLTAADLPSGGAPTFYGEIIYRTA